METYIPTPTDVGHELFGEMFFVQRGTQSAVLDTLLYVLKVPKATLAKMTGLTRARIGHYANLGGPIPQQRQEQLYFILRNITAAWHEDWLAVCDRPGDFGDRMVPETLPIAENILALCHVVLKHYEEEQKKRLEEPAD